MPNSRLSPISPNDGLSGRTLPSLPAAWAERLESQLSPEEKIVAWLETDLNAQLHFVPGLVVVTDKRLLATGGKEQIWQDWFYRPGLTLARNDHAGVGSLELFDESSLLARWRYTLSRDTVV